jgi:hypothetical protein
LSDENTSGPVASELPTEFAANLRNEQPEIGAAEGQRDGGERDASNPAVQHGLGDGRQGGASASERAERCANSRR